MGSFWTRDRTCSPTLADSHPLHLQEPPTEAPTSPLTSALDEVKALVKPSSADTSGPAGRGGHLNGPGSPQGSEGAGLEPSTPPCRALPEAPQKVLQVRAGPTWLP